MKNDKAWKRLDLSAFRHNGLEPKTLYGLNLNEQSLDEQLLLKERHIKDKFAKANDLVIKYSAYNNEGWPEIIERVLFAGLYGRITHTLVYPNGEIFGKDIAFAQVEYQVNDFMKEVNNMAVARLSRRLPHIVMKQKSTGNKLMFKGSQELDAGVLSDHFDVFAPKGYSVDALSFIAPDVIEKIITNAQDFDIEILDDLLIIYGHGALDIKALRSSATAIDQIMRSLHDNIDSYSDTRFYGKMGVSIEGQRLSRRQITTAQKTTLVFTGFLLFLGLWALAPGSQGYFIAYVFFILVAYLWATWITQLFRWVIQETNSQRLIRKRVTPVQTVAAILVLLLFFGLWTLVPRFGDYFLSCIAFVSTTWCLYYAIRHIAKKRAANKINSITRK